MGLTYSNSDLDPDAMAAAMAVVAQAEAEAAAAAAADRRRRRGESEATEEEEDPLLAERPPTPTSLLQALVQAPPEVPSDPLIPTSDVSGVPPSLPFRVVHKGGIRVRAEPHTPGAQDARTYDFLDVVRVEAGSEVNTPEGCLLRLKGGQGWVFREFGDLQVLQQLEANDAQQQQQQQQQSAQPQEEAAAPPSPVEPDSGAGWYVVTAETGLLVLEEPDVSGPSLLEVFLEGKVFEAAERVTTPRVTRDDGRLAAPARAFLRLARSGGGFVCAGTRTLPLCARAAPPVDERGDWCALAPTLMSAAAARGDNTSRCQVVYPGGVRIRAAPRIAAALTGAELVCGAAFRAVRRVRAAGGGDVFVLVSAHGESLEPEPGAAAASGGGSGGGGHSGGGSADGGGGSGGDGSGSDGEGADGGAADVLGWVPMSTDGAVEVAVFCDAPTVERGTFAYQSVVEEELCVQAGPHPYAPPTGHFLQPYSVVAVSRVFTAARSGGDGGGSDVDTYLELEDGRGWVAQTFEQDLKLARLADFPDVSPHPCRVLITAAGGAAPRVGPSWRAKRVPGELLMAGEEHHVSVLWSLPALPSSATDGRGAAAAAAAAAGGAHRRVEPSAADAGAAAAAGDRDAAAAVVAAAAAGADRDAAAAAVEVAASAEDVVSDVCWALVDGGGWVCVRHGRAPHRCGAVLLRCSPRGSGGGCGGGGGGSSADVATAAQDGVRHDGIMDA
ncbi:hypothetical protein JKP88DRAFT_352741, partial [Tribonema minus]